MWRSDLARVWSREHATFQFLHEFRPGRQALLFAHRMLTTSQAGQVLDALIDADSVRSLPLVEDGERLCEVVLARINQWV